MKVLQLLFDGYHPNNTTGWNTFTKDKILNKGYICKEYTSKDSTRNRLLSPEMWMRTLSNMEPSEATKRYNPEESPELAATNSRYRRVPNEAWIWNRLAKNGVKSFSFPYYLTYTLYEPHLLTGTEFDKNVNLVLKPYSKHRAVVDSGNYEHIRNGLNYSCFSEMFDKGTTPEYKQELYDAWKSEETIEKAMPKALEHVRNIVNTEVIPQLDKNLEMFREEVFPLLEKSIAQLEEGKDFYSFFGICETDEIVHFMTPYREATKVIENEYIDVLIKELMDRIDPDVIIIHGDHNMVTTRDYKRPKGTVQWVGLVDGVEQASIASNYSRLPLYYDHGNEVGGLVFVKPDHKNVIEEIETLNNSEECGLFMDSVFNWVTSNLGGIK